uniref:Uncharacterized protein LOC114344255 isoform X1 n=1 Tax=Diabrotica virgifera virgifera TaxID=50390 RepID=A0A6P7H4H0_DIAVI
MKSASIIIACVLFTEVFTSPTKRQTNNKNVSPGAIDSNYPSNSDNIYQTSNGPNAFPQANNGPDPFPQINNNPNQFNPLFPTNNGLNPFAPMINVPNPLRQIQEENTDNEDTKAPKNYFYSFPRANIIKIYYISGKSEPYDEPDVPGKGPKIGSSPIPTAAIASLSGGNFG